MSRSIKSLQLRLTIELAALFFVASCLAVAGLIYSASQTAGSLMDRELGLRAEDLARYVSLDAVGKPRLDLPADLSRPTTRRRSDRCLRSETRTDASSRLRPLNSLRCRADGHRRIPNPAFSS